MYGISTSNQMGSAKIIQQVEILKQQVELLKQRCVAAESRVSDLMSQKLQSQVRITELEMQNRELVSKYKNLQAGTASGRSNEEMTELKNRYLALIREIDDCIEKLNGNNP